ncbi:hypothetical protein BH10ACT1_BH10ACT1_42720 [soil metagenome]
MTTVPPTQIDAPAPVRWGLGDAVAGWLVAVSGAAILGAASISLAGYDQADVDAERLPLWLTLVQSPFLWFGFVGVPLFVAATKGRGFVADFRFRIRASDVGVGAVVGVVAQLVVVPLVTLPFLWLTDTDVDKLGEPAQKLADKVGGAPSVVLFVAIIAIGAPLAEEIFFRGLLLRSLENRLGSGWAIAISAMVFGITHFELLQLPALAAAGAIFAVLAVKTDRLGPAIVAHMAFNLTTVVHLIWIA